jgi:glycosyltransferase involved in cell wall biosynthesis
LFIELAASIASTQPDARFVMIGDGPLRKPIEASARRWGIDRRVLFTGEVADARALLPQIDVLVVPSRTDGAPLVVLEAMAAGTPVVSSRVGGIPEQIGDGEDGLLVGPGDLGGFVAAIRMLLEDPGLRGRLAMGGRERDGHRSFEETLGRLETIYRVAILEARRLGQSSKNSPIAPGREASRVCGLAADHDTDRPAH